MTGTSGGRAEAGDLRERLVALVRAALDEGPRVVVGIDGPDAAGKTTLADDLARLLPGTAVRAGIDGFHRPAEVRRRQGPLSPEGYYRDSFDHVALQEALLRPFVDGAGQVRTAVHEWTSDQPVARSLTPVPHVAALVFDGVFLHRPELRPWWDLSVYLHVPASVVLARAVLRDAVHVGSAAEVGRRFRARYLPGQEIYRAEADPVRQADVVVDNSDPAAPEVLSWCPRRPRRGAG